MKKFELTTDFITVLGIKLFRVRALIEFGDVKTGDLGGYVEKEENLAQYGNAWVYDNAWVYGNAWVSDNARVYGDARVYGNAIPVMTSDAGKYKVKCQCGSETSLYQLQDDAASAWNLRCSSDLEKFL